MTDYYEVKNWADLQHYTKRNPPWIKLYRRLLKEGDFQMLTEAEQWQLVRLWLVSAEEHPGGWIPNDQRWLRVMTGSTKPLPLKKLEKMGWLIARDASAHASAAASTDASALLDSRESEVSESNSKAVEPPIRLRRELPVEIEHQVGVLVSHIGSHADGETENVIRAYASNLPPQSLARALESSMRERPDNRAGYIVAVLKSECEERVA